MNNIVYFLGAGFSAPLNLPVISNFLSRAKNLYFSNPKKYQYFNEVIDVVKRMSVIKNYYHADMFNIEEILSILEMSYRLNRKEIRLFKDFITDVIKGHMPYLALSYHNNVPVEDWNGREFIRLFGPSIIGSEEYFGFFFASILNLAFLGNRRPNQPEITCHAQGSNLRYSIVTLNYDTVPESFAEMFVENYGSKVRFRRPIARSRGPKLAKLHGSIDGPDIIPPTWSKSWHHSIEPEWRMGLRLLRDAKHIRILGYSLSDADAYVRFLFKAAVLGSKNLKTFDVICLDPTGVVRKRYDDFLTFRDYRFVNSNVKTYLRELSKDQSKTVKHGPHGNTAATLDFEEAHQDFMTSGVTKSPQPNKNI